MDGQRPVCRALLLSAASVIFNLPLAKGLKPRKTKQTWAGHQRSDSNDLGLEGVSSPPQPAHTPTSSPPNPGQPGCWGTNAPGPPPGCHQHLSLAGGGKQDSWKQLLACHRSSGERQQMPRQPRSPPASDQRVRTARPLQEQTLLPGQSRRERGSVGSGMCVHQTGWGRPSLTIHLNLLLEPPFPRLRNGDTDISSRHRHPLLPFAEHVPPPRTELTPVLTTLEKWPPLSPLCKQETGAQRGRLAQWRH